MKGLRRAPDPQGIFHNRFCFYLVTWMKGLRPAISVAISASFFVCFYLVTWMKGLRPSACQGLHGNSRRAFLPCDLNEGITTYPLLVCDIKTFTRFYLVTWMKGLRPLLAAFNTARSFLFLPCDLNEGITTLLFYPQMGGWLSFLPCDLNEGITTSIQLLNIW